MLSQVSLVTLLLSSQALASPLYPFAKRQSPVASATDAATRAISVAVPTIMSAASSGMSAPISSAMSMASPASASGMSAMSSMMSGSSVVGAPMPTASMTNASMTNSTGNPLYPCPEGYSLSYVEEQRSYPNTTFSVLLQTVGGFQNASYFGVVNGTGGDMVGATRYLVSGHEEVLVSLDTSLPPNNMPGSTVERQSVFNLTNGPIEVGTGAMISNYSTVLQVYRNTSATNADGMVGGGEVGTVKLFSNFCASNQTAGALSQMRAFEGALENIYILAHNGTLGAENYSSLGATGVSTISRESTTMSSMPMTSMTMSSMSMSSMSMRSMSSMDSRASAMSATAVSMSMASPVDTMRASSSAR